MKITIVRRISQIFFFVLFVWFCIASTFGQSFWQLRNWPVNWFLQLDPLVGLGTILTTRTLYSGLLWAIATVALTLLLGRFFCGWLCPFGAMHHFIGYLGSLGRSAKEKNHREPIHGQSEDKILHTSYPACPGGRRIAGEHRGFFRAEPARHCRDPMHSGNCRGSFAKGRSSDQTDRRCFLWTCGILGCRRLFSQSLTEPFPLRS